MLNNVDKCPCRCAFDVFEFRLSKHVPRNSFTVFVKLRLNTLNLNFGRVSLIQDWILKSEEIQKRILRLFTRQINTRSLGSWCVKGTVDSSVSLTTHDPKDLGLICLVKKRKIHFRILPDLKIQSWIFFKKRTYLVYNSCVFLSRSGKCYGEKLFPVAKLQISPLELLCEYLICNVFRLLSSWLWSRSFRKHRHWKWEQIYVLKIVNKYRYTRETRYTVLLIVYLNRLLKTILLVTFITLSRVFSSKRIISCKCFRNKLCCFGQMDELPGNRMRAYFFLVFMFIAIIFVLLSTRLYIFSSRFFFLVSSIRFFHGTEFR